MNIRANVEKVQKEITSQTIVAATKYVTFPAIRELYDAGIRHVGENRVHDFLEKKAKLGDLDLTWHFIGVLQSNKVKQVINEIDYLHSLDRMSLANEIQKYRFQPLSCFVEVHITDETTKSGISPDAVIDFCINLAKCDKIVVVGLMGMAPLTKDEASIRNSFSLLQSLQKQILSLNLQHAPCQFLSMGMSNDYRIAIEYGATHLRLGSILFQEGE